MNPFADFLRSVRETVVRVVKTLDSAIETLRRWSATYRNFVVRFQTTEQAEMRDVIRQQEAAREPPEITGFAA